MTMKYSLAHAKKDPPNPQCEHILTQERPLPFAFTLAFTVLACDHRRWARDPLISSALAYNLITIPPYLQLF